MLRFSFILKIKAYIFYVSMGEKNHLAYNYSTLYTARNIF